jgi:hypothetical protein
MPRLQQALGMRLDNPLQASQFVNIEPIIVRHAHRPDPEFGGLVVAIHVYVRWLRSLVAEEVETVGPHPQSRWHSSNSTWLDPQIDDCLANNMRYRNARAMAATAEAIRMCACLKKEAGSWIGRLP